MQHRRVLRERQVRTVRKRLRRSAKAVAEWCRRNRHEPVDEQQKALNAKLRGHSQYYGRSTNKRDECKRSSDEASKTSEEDTQNRDLYPVPGNSMEGTYLLAVRGPVGRRHDSYLGFRTELENRVGDERGKGTSGRTTRPKVPMHRPGAHCFVVARKRGNARGAKGAGHPRWDWVNGKPEEPFVSAEGGSLLWGGTSRMNREVHVRICGRLGAKFPGPTRQVLFTT